MNRFAHSQSGNALMLVLIGVVLFGALAFSFMRSGRQGMSNMSAQEAEMSAQELISFFNQVEAAFGRLILKKCSVNDISFANSGDTGGSIASNDSPTAPPDKSCHIFDVNGGKVTFNMDWKKYQIPFSDFPGGNDAHKGNINLRNWLVSTVNIGTAAVDPSIQLNFIKPEICAAYNRVLGHNIDLSISDGGPVAGDENAGFAGKMSFCRYNGVSYQNRYTYLVQ